MPLTEPCRIHRLQMTSRVDSERVASCERVDITNTGHIKASRSRNRSGTATGIPHFTPLDTHAEHFHKHRRHPRSEFIRRSVAGHRRTHYLPSCLVAQMAIAVLYLLPIFISAVESCSRLGLAPVVFGLDRDLNIMHRDSSLTYPAIPFCLVAVDVGHLLGTDRFMRPHHSIAQNVTAVGSDQFLVPLQNLILRVLHRCCRTTT